MTALKNSNGWQRIWLIVSAISFIYAIGLGVFGGVPPTVNYEVVAGFNNPACAVILQMSPGSKLESELRYDDPCQSLYLYRLVYEGARETEDGYLEHMSSERNLYILGNVGFLLLMWLISMAMLYGVGTTVAWVLRGFRSKQEP